MLGTLMKYEFKANGRILLPLYAAWFVVSILLGLSIRTDGASEPSVLMIVLSALLYAFVAAAAVIITGIILIQRFYKNLLGNEGYFMFTLPVSTGQHITNKILSGTIWVIFGVLTAILSAVAIAISIEGFQTVLDGMSFMTGETKLLFSAEPTAPLLVVEVILICIVASAEVVANIYAAIALGHLWSNHRLLGAVLAYIALSIIESAVTGIIEQILSSTSLEWFYNMDAVVQSHLILLVALAACGAMLAIYWFVSWKILDRKLNLE